MKQTNFTNTPLEKSNGVFHFMRQFCFITVLAFTFGVGLNACEDRQKTPDWGAEIASQQPDEPKLEVRDKVDNEQRRQVIENIEEKKQIIADLEADPKPLRFVCYNLKNYLTMPRGRTEEFKPEHEVKALIANIVRANPHILGVCEIGNQKDLDHLLDQLKIAGLEFKHSYLSEGPDPYRRQALLSKFPIQKNQVPKYTYKMKGETHEIRRGILDATVATPQGEIRLLGVHLKSKRPIAIYDQAEIRKEEALILREHASSVLSETNQKVIVFGDMNDTKGSSTVRIIRGSKDKQLTPIELFDKQGTKWTQYWAQEDIYSRFDYVFVSDAMIPWIDQEKSFILDTPPNDPASDHRALVILIKESP